MDVWRNFTKAQPTGGCNKYISVLWVLSKGIVGNIEEDVDMTE